MASRNNFKKNDIEGIPLLEISRDTNEQRGTTTIIRVVDWVSGTKHYPQLEKREFFVDGDTGNLKTGKAKGFTLKDLGKVQDAWGEIMVALGNKVPASDPIPKSNQSEPVPASAGITTDF